MDRGLSLLEKWVAGLTIGIAVLFTFIAVILRYFFGYSISGLDELTRFLIIWSVFVGGSLAIREEKHITIDLVTASVSPKVRAILQGIAYLAGAFFAFYIMILGYQVVANSIKVGEISLTSLAMPMFIPRAAVFIGGLLMGIRFLQQSYLAFSRSNQ
jgi:C4-dicarboxylate transporter DctQ subunit